MTELEKTKIVQHVLKMLYNSLLPEHKNEFVGVFSNVCSCLATQAFKWFKKLNFTERTLYMPTSDYEVYTLSFFILSQAHLYYIYIKRTLKMFHS